MTLFGKEVRDHLEVLTEKTRWVSVEKLAAALNEKGAWDGCDQETIATPVAVAAANDEFLDRTSREGGR